MKKLVFIGILFLVSCTPVKRLERLHKKHPYLFENVKDTIKYEGTAEIEIKGWEIYDTFKIMDVHKRLVHLNTTLDLVYKDSNVLFNVKVRDTSVKAKYKGEITANKYEVKIEKRNKWKKIITTTGILLIIVVILWILIKRLI